MEATGDRIRPFHVVALGASAGGLEALEKFFDHMPADSGMAFVVVLHLSPDYRSLMAELLCKHTHMRVLRAVDGAVIEPGNVYLIQPKTTLTVFHGRLVATEQEHAGRLHLPIDVFMRSLAEDAGEHALGVILSGTGSDGMRGVCAIKEAGGAVFVQQPETARFDGMPRSAMSTGLADDVLPPEAMPRHLLGFIGHRAPLIAPSHDPPPEDDAGDYTRILALLRKDSGLDFTHYRTNTVVRRIERRLRVQQLDSLADYYRMLVDSPGERVTLCKELLIGVTSFFRDRDAWQIVESKVVPALFETAGRDGALRVWVAGCSTGEEAYSIAMLLQEHRERERLAFDFKIFATDVDRDAVEFAGAGEYPESIAADLSPDRLSRFFQRRGDRYVVTRPIRESVVFANQNLLRDPPFTRLDLVCCRNVLIYFQPTVQRSVLGLFAFALKQGGHLLLGSSETVGELASDFEAIDHKWKVFRMRGDGRQRLLEPVSADRLPRLRARMAGYAGLRPQEPGRVQEALYEAIIGDYVPAGLAVGGAFEPLHVFGDISPYFRLPPGRMTLNVLQMAHPDLSALLSTAISRA